MDRNLEMVTQEVNALVWGCAVGLVLLGIGGFQYPLIQSEELDVV